MPKKTFFEKNLLHVTVKEVGLKFELLMKFLDDSAWFCVKKLKKHGLERPKSFKNRHNIKKDPKNKTTLRNKS